MARKRSDSTGSASINAEIDKVLNELVEGLTASDDHLRHQAIARVLAVTMPDLRGRVADRLVDLLGSKDKELRRRAAASLAELGGAVTANLVLQLLKTQDETMRGRLLEILARIALTTPGTERSSLIVDLIIAALTGQVPRSTPPMEPQASSATGAVRTAL